MFFGCSGCGRSGLLILQKTADIANRGCSCKRKNPSAGVFKTFPAVTVTELFQARTGLVSLLRSFTRVEKMIHCLFCHRPNGHCPCFEIFCIVRQIPLMLLWHMLQLHQRFTLLCLQTAVARNAAAMKIHLNDSFCYANVYFFANQIVWNGIFVPAVTHEQTRQRLQTVQQAAAAYTPVLPQDRRCGACRCAA